MKTKNKIKILAQENYQVCLFEEMTNASALSVTFIQWQKTVDIRIPLDSSGITTGIGHRIPAEKQMDSAYDFCEKMQNKTSK